MLGVVIKSTSPSATSLPPPTIYLPFEQHVYVYKCAFHPFSVENFCRCVYLEGKMRHPQVVGWAETLISQRAERRIKEAQATLGDK
jgi:hypothetical protein